MDDKKIIEKILNNKKLSIEEVEHIIYKWNVEDCFEKGKRDKWWLSMKVIFKVNNKYYSIRYKSSLVDWETSQYFAQKAIEVEKVAIRTYKWKKVRK